MSTGDRENVVALRAIHILVVFALLIVYFLGGYLGGKLGDGKAVVTPSPTPYQPTGCLWLNDAGGPH